MASGFDPHTQPHEGVTFPQLTLAIAALIAFVLWLQRLPNRLFTKSPAEESKTEDGTEDGVTSSSSTVVKIEDKSGNVAEESGTNGASLKKFSKARPPPTLDEFLMGVVEFTLIMLMFYVCDYKKVGTPLVTPVSQDIYPFRHHGYIHSVVVPVSQDI